MAGTRTDFQSELLNFKEKVARLPKEVKADPPYWINRIKEKTSDGLLAAFEREVKNEVKSGNGGVQHVADHEWIIFSRVMCRKRSMLRRNVTRNQQQSSSSPRIALQHMAWGLGGASSREDARQHATCAMVSNAHTKATPTAHVMCLHSAYHSIAPRRYCNR